jgi:hypothetical protein
MEHIQFVYNRYSSLQNPLIEEYGQNVLVSEEESQKSMICHTYEASKWGVW